MIGKSITLPPLGSQTNVGSLSMNLYNATATPILDFTKNPAANSGVYIATLPDASILGELAPTAATAFLPLEELTAKMDFVHPDSAPAGLLNEVIWKSVKGMNSKMPAPRHTLLSLTSKPAVKATAKTSDAD